MCHVLVTRRGLDEWARLGAFGGDAAAVLPMVKRQERNDAERDHGHCGTVLLRDIPTHNPCGTADLAATT